MAHPVLDQNSNYRAEFGLVFRSSAIFAILKDCDCTLSVFNYWKIKNDVQVSIVITERSVVGEIFKRSILEFQDSDVHNYRPCISEGSVEIEAFSSRNMRIPYAAVLGIYETPNSIAMVHSYGRNHAPSEIEDGTAILDARESCISLRCDPLVETRAIFHNGNLPVSSQAANLILTSKDGRERDIEFLLDEIAPYETVQFEIGRIAPDFRQFLQGQDGWATLHFANHSAFPRMMVCWFHRESSAVQATHSNFDYTQFSTNLLPEGASGTIALPELAGEIGRQSVVVYPRCTPGHYALGVREREYLSDGGSVIPVDFAAGERVSVKAVNGLLPSRLVTGLFGIPSAAGLPFECSLGIFHSKRPPKRFHWMAISARHASRIYVTSYPEIYGEPESVTLRFCLFSPSEAQPLTCTRQFDCLTQVPPSYGLEDLFDEPSALLGSDYGYLTCVSEWGGFLIYASMQKEHSLAIEHSF